MQTMKAVHHHQFGLPDVLEVQEVDKPDVPDDGVLVRVRASSVNPADLYTLKGRPYVGRLVFGLRKPRDELLGVDFAGTVESVGQSVTQFQPGDEVFGGGHGAFAEYLCVRESRGVVPKPSSVTLEQAGSVAVAASTALQALRDHGHFQPGQRVLINGASGGVGTFAVQIAKALGAEVTGVCSPRNVEQVQSLGADRVIDYTKEDFTRIGQRFDLMLDIAGSRTYSECRRVLHPKATIVVVGGSSKNRWLGPASHLIKMRLSSLRGGPKVAGFVASITKDDLEVLGDLMASGKVTPVIDRTYELSRLAEAFRYLGEGHAKGKIVITV